ncbi:MAG: FkbM family methyltransferase [Terriglobales bacterium]
MTTEWFRLRALTALRQRSRHRLYRFRFRSAPAGTLRVTLRPRWAPAAAGATITLRPATSDRRIFEQVFLDDEYDLRALARWPELDAAGNAEPAPLILDLGANIGLASLALHWQFPRARILALEPEPGNFAQLCHNVAGIAAITPLHAAVAPRDGWVRILNPTGPSAGFRTEPAAAETPAAIPARSIDSLLADAPALVIKMDIEGAERDLFADGATRWLARTRLLIVEPHDWAFPGQALSQPLLVALAARAGDVLVRGEHLLCFECRGNRGLETRGPRPASQ